MKNRFSRAFFTDYLTKLLTAVAVLLFPSDHARKATEKIMQIFVSRVSRLRRSLDPSRATELTEKKETARSLPRQQKEQNKTVVIPAYNTVVFRDYWTSVIVS